MEQIHVSFITPAIIKMEELKAARMPSITWNSMRKEFPGGLDLRRVESEGPGFLFRSPNFGQKARAALERYLYNKYKYRFPPK